MRLLSVVLVLAVLAGCASYEQHYGRFVASNSAGDQRQFLLTWQSADYPDWAFSEDQATAITLRSQCSERVWRLRTRSAGSTCGEGITACGEPGKDLSWKGEPIERTGHVCMRLTDARGADRASDLTSPVQLTVSCYPENVTETRDGEEINMDYLKASRVPYTIHTKTSALHSLEERPPELSDNVCKKE